MVLLAASVIVLIGAVALARGTGPLAELAARVGIGAPERLLPQVHPAVESSAYTILEHDAAGDPVTYDPCRPVHFVINPAGGPADYLSFILPAVDAAQRASGLKFEYDGLSDETWRDRQDGGSGPVVIDFVRELSGSTATSETVGIGGSSWLTLDGAVQPHYTTGAVGLKQSWFQSQSAQRRTAAEQAVVMHELGHVLGLDHVADPAQLMAPTNNGQTDYGPGDLAGLAVVGSGACAG